ncbi:UDP-glucose 4-epimerase GalE [Mumia zhuanghuii]|uniref:UDP-glucose 4-epimerase GalE n=1 Tax=Mumia zhuanghuii TaxID=2585211 RepID=UPI00363FE03F
MTWLVTGGAGYIGSHVVRAFLDADIEVVVLDSLETGFREFVPGDVPFVEANVTDTDTVRTTLRGHAVRGVVHVAGYKYAGVSVHRPLHTYEQNVTGTVHLLEAMAEEGVESIVFSSSAAVYGTPDTEIVTETTPTSPESPYGESKLVDEWVLRAQAVATGLRQTSLRYFNVVGSGYEDLYDASPHNLFPKVFKTLTDGGVPMINGDDYATPDGTCVRDYVSVTDLAHSHVVAARALANEAALEPVYNLGSGEGVSVRQIVDTIASVTGIDFVPTIGPRRPGDPARIVASGELAARDLEWAMRHDLTDMVRSAWGAWMHVVGRSSLPE